MRVVVMLIVVACAGASMTSAQPRPLTLSQLTWFDRLGKQLGTLGPLADHGNIELSPDGTNIASAVVDRTTGTRDIWTYRVPGGAATRLTSSPADENWMVWSADGLRAVVNAFDAEAANLFELPMGMPGTRRRLAPDDAARWPVSLSPDGRFLLYVTNSPRTGNDIWVLPMAGAQQAYPFARTAAAENWATFSPDGRFVAYSSTEGGAAEVFVTPFPGPGPKWRMSVDTGTQTRWRQPNELVYIDATRRLMAVTLRVETSTVDVVSVTPLFEITYPYGAYHAFDISKDGQRIIVARSLVSGSSGVTVADAGSPPAVDGMLISLGRPGTAR